MTHKEKFIVRLVCLIIIALLMYGIAQGSPYVAVGSGVFKPDIDNYYIRGFQSADDSTKAVNHIALSYDFNNDWALEVGYEKFGTFGWKASYQSEGQINTQISAQTLYVGLKRYFGNTYGIVGSHRWICDAEISRSLAGPNNQHISGTGGMFGIGHDIVIADHFGVRLSYTKFMGIGNQNLIGTKTDAGVVGIAFILN